MKYNPYTGYFQKGEDSPDIIGQTQSGKNVLGGNQEKYATGFSAEDHQDAENIHIKRKTKAQGSARASMLSGGKFDHAKLMRLASQASKHHEAAEWHKEERSEREDQSEGTGEKEKVEKAKKLSNGHSNGRGKDKIKRKKKKTSPWAYLFENQKEDPKAQERFDNNFADFHDDHLNGDRKHPLTKGGPGSGRKGHKTNRNPYPGEDTKDSENQTKEAEEFKTLPLAQLPPESVHTPMLAKYRKLLLNSEGRLNGLITYDAKTDTIQTHPDPEKRGILTEYIAGAKKEKGS